MILDNLIEDAILITYIKEPHCFIAGCGRETLMHWIHQTTKVWICPKMLRRYMIKLVSQKIFKISKTAHGYTCFQIKNKGKFLIGIILERTRIMEEGKINES